MGDCDVLTSSMFQNTQSNLNFIETVKICLSSPIQKIITSHVKVRK